MFNVLDLKKLLLVVAIVPVNSKKYLQKFVYISKRVLYAFILIKDITDCLESYYVSKCTV